MKRIRCYADVGRSKCLRAMVYHDLVVMFGDVPFTFLPASQLGDNYVIPVMNREEIQNKLIEDLQDIAPKMSSTTTTTVERASKEFAWALIARIALTAGGIHFIRIKIMQIVMV